MGENKLGCVGCGTNLSDLTMFNFSVKGKKMFLPGLDDMMSGVQRKRLQTRKEVREELRSRLPDLCQVPAGEEEDYVSALMEEYDRRASYY
jgi:hypothetical protein